MRLEFTPQGIADVEEKAGRAFVQLLGDQENAMSVRNVLLVLSAGLGGSIDEAGKYLTEWCEENDKTYFEIYEHIIKKLEGCRFFSLDSQAQVLGNERKAKEVALSQNIGGKAKSKQ
jgi:hypothetical protein